MARARNSMLFGSAGQLREGNTARVFVELANGGRWRVLLRPQQLDQLKQVRCHSGSGAQQPCKAMGGWARSAQNLCQASPVLPCASPVDGGNSVGGEWSAVCAQPDVECQQRLLMCSSCLPCSFNTSCCLAYIAVQWCERMRLLPCPCCCYTAAAAFDCWLLCAAGA